MRIKQDRSLLIIRIFAVIGVALAVYLLYSYLFRPSFQPCSINAQVNCDAIIKGPVSTFLGLPTALYGLVGYIAIFLLSFTKKIKLLLAVALFGLVFCLRITMIEVFSLKVYCPVCLACQADMILIFILALRRVALTRTKG